MTPLLFESRYRATWQELAALLDQCQSLSWQNQATPADWAQSSARLLMLYRHTCDHLALARARGYPPSIIDPLEVLTQRAHTLIYRYRDWGGLSLNRLILVDIPQTVRALQVYVWVAALLFYLPLLALGLTTYFQPDFILHFLSPEQVVDFQRMYSDRPAGAGRDAQSDILMLGGYIKNNIGIGFQCFAGGLLAGVGSVFFIAYNGLFIGAVAGYITAQGLGDNFYSFVITHGAFELTGIVLSGAAGLYLGHALLCPGRRTRVEALKHHARAAVVLMYVPAGASTHMLFRPFSFL